MNRIPIIAAIALAISLWTLAAAYAQDAFATGQPGNPLVGVWQSPVARFQFMPDGTAYGQQISAAVVYTSVGTYSFNGDVLAVHFDSVRPAMQCAASSVASDFEIGGECTPAIPISAMSYRVRFDGPGEFIWGFDQPGASIFERLQ